jgi:hypothetical protein
VIDKVFGFDEKAIAQSSEFFSTVSAAKKAGDRALTELFENQLIS